MFCLEASIWLGHSVSQTHFLVKKIVHCMIEIVAVKNELSQNIEMQKILIEN